MDFITIDFETADVYRDSPCEIGLTFVENNEIKETKSWLIKPNCWPFFDDYVSEIHNIRPEDVSDALTFEELWPEIHSLINNKNLIAHNAGFDFSVLRSTLALYELEHPQLDYACSYIFSKQAWPGLHTYSLDHLCYMHNIDLTHHRAGHDSLATAQLSLKVFKDFEINSFDDLSTKLRTKPGKLFSGGYDACQTKRSYSHRENKLDMSRFVADPSKENPDSIFYESKVVFTGTLSSISRDTALQSIVDVGGIISDTLTKDVNFLIVGAQNRRVVGESGLSGKQKKAAMYAEKGAPIEIVTEDFYLQNL